MKRIILTLALGAFLLSPAAVMARPRPVVGPAGPAGAGNNTAAKAAVYVKWANLPADQQVAVAKGWGLTAAAAAVRWDALTPDAQATALKTYVTVKVIRRR